MNRHEKIIIGLSVIVILLSFICFGRVAHGFTITDNLARANESPIVLPWETNATAGYCYLTSNHMTGSLNAGVTGWAKYSDNTIGFNADQSIEAVVNITFPGNTHLAVRTNKPLTGVGDTGYDCMIGNSGAGALLYDCTTWTLLATWSFGMNNGDKFKCEIVGNVINLYRNDVLINTYTDTANKTPSGGTPQIGLYENALRVSWIQMTGAYYLSSGPTGPSFGFGGTRSFGFGN